jgi:nitrile hydratase beta subunit
MPDVHDLGGNREHFGPIDHTSGEPPFHAEWERRVFGINAFTQTLGLFGPNFDRGRATVEQMSPPEYAGPYYTHWLYVMEHLLAKYISGERKVPAAKSAVTARVVRVVMSRPTLPRWVNTQVMPRMFGSAKPAKRPPRFAVGDAVRVRAERSDGHTRQPGYVTGRLGRITEHRGAAIFADEHVRTGFTAAEHLYTVAFDGAELWGEKAEPDTEIRIELFEPYLEPA